jgi:hypothetical protein
MNKIIRFFPIIFLFFLLIYLIYELTKKEEIKFETKNLVDKKRLEMQFKKTHLKEIDEKGNILWEFEANSLNVDIIQGKNYLSGIEGKVYENNKPSIFLKAENLIVDLNTKNFTLLEAEGKKEKLFLKAGEIRFDGKNKKIFCSKNPFFKKGEITIKSDFIEADIGIKIIKFKGKTQTFINRTSRKYIPLSFYHLVQKKS